MEGNLEVIYPNPSFRCGNQRQNTKHTHLCRRQRLRIERLVLHLEDTAYFVERELGLFCLRRSGKAFFLCPSLLSWIIFVVRTWTYRMFFQQKLYVRGRCCSPGKGTTILTATTDLEEKYYISLIPEDQLSQNYAVCSLQKQSRTPCF